MNKVCIIAEIGINHNGSLDNCLKLVDAAVTAGCDAVKLQFFKADNLYPRSAGELDWQDGEKEYSYPIHEAVKSFELPEPWLDQIVDYCRKADIELLASAFDFAGIDFLVEQGISKLKLSSYCAGYFHVR